MAAVARRQVRVVQGHDRRLAVAAFRRQQIQQCDLMMRVEVMGRFVQQVEFRLLRQQCCQGQAAPFAARQRRAVALFDAVQVGALQRLPRQPQIGGAFAKPQPGVWG